MVYVLLFVVAATALGAALCFEQKFVAVATVVLVFGLGYGYWGFISAMGVPDELVTAESTTKIWTGLVLIVIGTVMFGIHWFRDIRSRMPRH